MANLTSILRILPYEAPPLNCLPKREWIKNIFHSSTVGTCAFLDVNRALKTQTALLSLKKYTKDQRIVVKSDGTQVRKKKPVVMINLLSNTGQTVMPKEEAIKIAKEKHLNLVKVEKPETPSTRETYKLEQDNIEFSKSRDKSVKNITLSTSIMDHDIKIKAKSISKILQKYGEINCSIKFPVNQDNLVSDTLDKLKKELNNLKVLYTVTCKSQRSYIHNFYIVSNENKSNKASEVESGMSPESELK